MRLIDRWRAWRVRRAEDELADAEERLSRWSFGMIPSERRRARERIEKARRRLDALTGIHPE